MKIIAGVLLAGAIAAGIAAVSDNGGHRLPAPPAGPPKLERVAGCFGRDYIDGPALESSIADHKIWTIDEQGNQYVLATPTNAVRCIGTDGMMRTIAGDDRKLPAMGMTEGPAGMLPSGLGGTKGGHRGSGVYLTVKGAPLEGEEKGCIFVPLDGYPCKIFKNKEKDGRWWFKVIGKGSQPLPAKAGASVAFKDANLKGVRLGGTQLVRSGCLYRWEGGEDGKITCLLTPADYQDKVPHLKTGKSMGAAEKISVSEDGTMYILYYGKSYPSGRVFRIAKDRSKVEEIVRSAGGKDGPGLKSGYHCGPYGLMAFKDVVFLSSVDSNCVRRWKGGRVSTLCLNDGEWREIYKVRGKKAMRAKGWTCRPKLGYVYIPYPGEERGGVTGIWRFGPIDFTKPTVGPLVGGK